MTQTNLDNLKDKAPDEVDREILKTAVLRELETINMYEGMAEMTKNIELRKILLGVIREKRTHVGEFQAQIMQAGFNPEDFLDSIGASGFGIT